jgi:hypothetical protein
MTDEAVMEEAVQAQTELTDEQKRAKRRGLAQKAINLAMANRWDEAIAVNTEILKLFPDDPEASNRMGNAYSQLNRVDAAMESYQNTLSSQPTNVIAQRNLDRLQRLAEAGINVDTATQKLAPAFFMEDVGKTGVTTLAAVRQETALRATAGEEVMLKESRGTIKVSLADGSALGKIEPSLAERLTRLMKSGNKYQAGVVMAEPGRFRILVREVVQSTENEGRISFPPRTAAVRGYTRDGLLRRSGEGDDDLDGEGGDSEEMDDDDENPSEFGFSETSITGEADPD